MLRCKQYSSKYELHKIKIFHCHTSLAWRETKKKTIQQLERQQAWDQTSSDRNTLDGWILQTTGQEFLVYGRDASFPNYMWRKLNAQCSAMYIRQVHVRLLLIITLNFWTRTKAIAALPTFKTYLNGTYIFLTSTSEHGDSVVKVVNSLRMLLRWDESQNYCWCVRRGSCYG